jgi:spermidine synthase
LPLAFLNQSPQNVLIICFGMGTTFRSAHSWNISATAVDLIPSVPKLFSYYHADASEVLRSPKSHVVVDDGRRFLERTTEQYDVITVDPPPPVETAGSSLLYSEQFYGVAKLHLKPQGIMQQWLPSGDAVVRSSVARALRASFTYVRVFHSVTGEGYQFLASDQPFPERNSQELAERLPASAAKDFVEWGPAPTAAGQFEILLRNEISLDWMMADAPDAPAMVDDRPTNEYFIWRVVNAYHRPETDKTK